MTKALLVGSEIPRLHLVGDVIVRALLAGNGRVKAHPDGSGTVNRLLDGREVPLAGDERRQMRYPFEEGLATKPSKGEVTD